MSAPDRIPPPGEACGREDELLDALQAPSWPLSATADLQAHVAACASCRDLAAIMLALVDEHHAAVVEAAVPSAGAVWFRAQLRARHEAAAAAARPISLAQFVSMACAVGLLAGGVSLLVPAAAAWFGGTAALAAALPVPSLDFWTAEWFAPATIGVLLALTLVMIAAPVAIYLAIADD